MAIRARLVDAAIAVWAVGSAGGFAAYLLMAAGQSELETVGRCVYLVVIAAGIVRLAVRAIRKY